MIKNRVLFIVLLLFFTCLRLGLDNISMSENQLSHEAQRKILQVDSGNDESVDSGESQSVATTQDTDTEEEPESSATCISRFDTTIGVVLFTAGVLYCFVGLAIICEGEFKDSVVEIANFFKLPPDVAGATIMAAGTSSPELFASLIALAGPVADIGTGTVVGSAIFNVFIIIGGCVLFSSHIFHLNWKPVLRDCIINLFSFVFLYVVFFDGLVYWYEAFLGCFFYLCYVAMMGVNTHIMNAFEKTANFCVAKMPFLKIMQDPNTTEDPTNVAELEDFLEKSSSGTELGDLSFDDDLEELSFGVDDDDDEETARKKSLKEDVSYDIVDEHEHRDHDHYPSAWYGWIWFVLAWPYEILFHYTVPPVKGKYKYQFFASFFMSLVWLGICSTFMVKWTEKLGCILGVEDAIMGVTFLAIGTSMPDCLTSIFIARTGRGNMAVCNALGSNIFDILLALCLPWALSTVISRAPVAVVSDTLTQDVIILTGTLMIFFISLCVSRWRLNKKIGYLFYFLYILFVTYTVVRELFF